MITEQQLIERAEEILDKRLERGGLADVIDEITNNHADMAEFEATLWAYLRENDKSLRYVAKKYAYKWEEEIREELEQLELLLDEEKKVNKEGW